MAPAALLALAMAVTCAALPPGAPPFNVRLSAAPWDESLPDGSVRYPDTPFAFGGDFARPGVDLCPPHGVRDARRHAQGTPWRPATRTPCRT
jgi:hypothetical protein